MIKIIKKTLIDFIGLPRVFNPRNDEMEIHFKTLNLFTRGRPLRSFRPLGIKKLPVLRELIIKYLPMAGVEPARGVNHARF